jgi:acetolactate synthase regulatory subunit
MNIEEKVREELKYKIDVDPINLERVVTLIVEDRKKIEELEEKLTKVYDDETLRLCCGEK